MALSNYLTGDEWDACFYASMGKCAAPDLTQSMRKTVDHLLKNGYTFEGLDEDGDSVKQVGDGENAPKLATLMGIESMDVNKVLEMLNNGRRFISEHCHKLLNESDEDWDRQTKEAGGGQTK